MHGQKVFDIIGIGIGPFNLGLAALCSAIPELNCLFIDQNESFNWHPGLMIPGTTLQVPFYADLVTSADPKNGFAYMCFLNARQRMYRFAIHENNFVKRTEYNEYCRWVAGQLDSLLFNETCIAIEKTNDLYAIKTNKATYYTKHIVIGIGTVPFKPPFAKDINHPLLFHSGEYLFRKEKILQEKRITIIGSGQSAAEIFYDLLHCCDNEIFWFSRADHLYPMDYSKFALEKTSHDYIDHFYSLPETVKPGVLSKQDRLYKGINAELLTAIYDCLRDKQRVNVHIHPACDLQNISDEFELSFYHREKQQPFVHKTSTVILATGYQSFIPAFIEPIRERLQWNERKQYAVNRNYSIDPGNTIFVQNADLHTHGFNSADLGMGPYRNSIILNTILGYEHFKIEKKVTFQNFGLPPD